MKSILGLKKHIKQSVNNGSANLFNPLPLKGIESLCRTPPPRSKNDGANKCDPRNKPMSYVKYTLYREKKNYGR